MLNHSNIKQKKNNNNPNFSGFMVVSLASGSGKTITSILLLNYLKYKGFNCNVAKFGPDYLDQKILTNYSHNKSCYNIDTFSMNEATIDNLLQTCSKKNELFLIEGAMGLFDGAKNNLDNSVTFCEKYNIAQILVVSANSSGQTIAYIVKAILNYYKTNIKYLIINNVSSKNHKVILASVFSKILPNIVILAYIYKDQLLSIKSRYLGLATEKSLVNFEAIEKASEVFNRTFDQENFDKFIKKLSVIHKVPSNRQNIIKPKKTTKTSNSIGQNFTRISFNINKNKLKIAIANDQAFFFIYQHILDQWKKLDNEICFFSPLKNQPIPTDSNLVYLPGGYPELYIKELSNNKITAESITEYNSYNQGKIYAECAGAIMLGKSITTKDGKNYKGWSLTNTLTDFRLAKLHLGYRKVTSLKNNFFAKKGETFLGHEFHYTVANNYSSVYNNNNMWQTYDADNNNLGYEGFLNNEDNIISSFIHIIDKSK